MKWQAKPIKDWKQGDTRVVARFAFIPMRLDNDEIIWMEFYYEKQEYQQACAIGSMIFPSYWEKIKRWQ